MATTRRGGAFTTKARSKIGGNPYSGQLSWLRPSRGRSKAIAALGDGPVFLVCYTFKKEERKEREEFEARESCGVGDYFRGICVVRILGYGTVFWMLKGCKRGVHITRDV